MFASYIAHPQVLKNRSPPNLKQISLIPSRFVLCVVQQPCSVIKLPAFHLTSTPLPPTRLTLPHAMRIPTDKPTYSYKSFNLLQQLQQIDFWAESGLLENFRRAQSAQRKPQRATSPLWEGWFICWIVCEAKYVGGKTNAHHLRICMFSWKYSMSYCYELTIPLFQRNTKTVCQLVSVMHWIYICVQEFCCWVALIERNNIRAQSVQCLFSTTRWFILGLEMKKKP